MLKKLMLLGAIFTLSTGTAIAQAGPYVGASIGLTNNSQNTKGPGVNGTFGTYRGVPANLFAGYGGVIGQTLHLAAEFGATLGTANISNNDDLKSSYGVDASVIPGLMLSEKTMAFARVGMVYSRFPNAANGSTSRSGGKFGLGMQTGLTQNLDLRGEYDFVAYEAKNETTLGIPYSVAPRSDQVTIGLVYKLD